MQRTALNKQKEAGSHEPLLFSIYSVLMKLEEDRHVRYSNQWYALSPVTILIKHTYQ